MQCICCCCTDQLDVMIHLYPPVAPCLVGDIDLSAGAVELDFSVA